MAGESRTSVCCTAGMLVGGHLSSRRNNSPSLILKREMLNGCMGYLTMRDCQMQGRGTSAALWSHIVATAGPEAGKSWWPHHLSGKLVLLHTLPCFYSIPSLCRPVCGDPCNAEHHTGCPD